MRANPSPLVKSATLCGLRQNLLILRSSVESLAPVMAVRAAHFSQDVSGLAYTGKGKIMVLNQLLL